MHSSRKLSMLIKRVFALVLIGITMGSLGSRASSTTTAVSTDGCILMVELGHGILYGSCPTDSPCGEKCRPYEFTLGLGNGITETQYWCGCPDGEGDATC